MGRENVTRANIQNESGAGFQSLLRSILLKVFKKLKTIWIA